MAEICRKLEITETTFYRWKKKYGGLGVSELRELRQLREENRKLKQLVADLSLDKHILRDSLKKNSKTGSTEKMGDVDSRGISSFGAAGLFSGWSCAFDSPISFSTVETGTSQETLKGTGGGSHQLRLPPPSHSASTRGLADQSQACLPALQRGRAGAQAQEAQATQKCYGSSNQPGCTQSKRTVGDGLHA